MPTRRPRSSASPSGMPTTAPLERLYVLGYGVSRKRLEQAIRDLQLPVIVVREPDEADLVITLRNMYRRSRRSSARRRRGASPSTC